jgi:hypothetical protein
MDGTDDLEISTVKGQDAGCFVALSDSHNCGIHIPKLRHDIWFAEAGEESRRLPDCHLLV